MKNIALLALTTVFAFSFASCKKDQQTEQENITKITLHLSGSGGFDQTFSWSDPDGGDIGNAVVDDILIPAGTNNITCSITVLDESNSPVVNLTDEIKAESDAHLLVFTPSGSAIQSIAYGDQDSNGKPLGLETTWVAGTGTGALQIRLFHQPVTKDDLSNPGGEIDFDISFPVAIQ